MDKIMALLTNLRLLILYEQNHPKFLGKKNAPVRFLSG